MRPRLAFTLIELLIAIGIIAIITAAIFTALNPAQRLSDARDSVRRSDGRALQQALTELSIGDTAAFSLFLQDIAGADAPENAVSVCRPGVASSSACVNADVLVPRYLTALPVDPSEESADVTGFAVYRTGVGVAVVALHLGETVTVASVGSSSSSSSESVSSAAASSSSESVSSSTSASSSSALPVSQIAIDLTRATSGSPRPFVVRATATDGNDAPVSGLALVITASEGAVSAVTETSNGIYEATVTPAANDRMVTVTASAGGVSATKTALVLTEIASTWDQPELVGGLVNTAGWEDSAEVSHDGDRLIVGTYSPVSLFCCMNASPGTALCPETSLPREASVACETARGPHGSPERPGMRGAGRIVSSSHIVDDAVSFGLLESNPADIPMPPVGAYIFTRQSDGTFAAPRFLGFEMDGYSYAPFGFTFIGASSTVTFAYDDPVDGPDTGNNIYEAPVSSVGDTIFGTYTLGTLSAPTFSAVSLLPGPQGNPMREGSRLWADSENGAQDIHVSVDGGEGFSSFTTAGMSSPSIHESQPFMDGATLYFTKDFVSIAAANFLGGAYGSPSSWSSHATQLRVLPSGTPPVGSLIGLGETSIAHASDGDWLYFVFIQRTATGLDAGVARVKAR